MPSMKCPKCGEKIEKEWQECPHCNATLRIACKKCGQELKEDWLSCPNCGKKKIDYNKVKLQALVAIALFIIGIIMANVVYLDFPFNETYTDKEPYTVTETYTAKEPYVVEKLVTKTEKYLICGDATFDISNEASAIDLSNKSAYSNCLIVGPYFYRKDDQSTLPNLGGWYHSITNTPIPNEYIPDYIPPKDYWNYFPAFGLAWTINVGTPDGFVEYTQENSQQSYILSIPRTQCVCEIKEKRTTAYENVTEYKDVTKTRTVTKYKDVEKTRTVTKKAKIWDIIFGNA